MNRNAKKSITFRVDAQNLDALQKIANTESISLNALTNKVIQDYVQWHAFSAQSGLISFPKDLLMSLMEDKTEKEIEKLANQVAKNTVKDIIVMMRNKFTPDSFINIVETWAKVSHMTYRHNTAEGNHKFILQHNLGMKWSLYLSKHFDFVFDKLEVKSSTDITDNNIILKIDTTPN